MTTRRRLANGEFLFVSRIGDEVIVEPCTLRWLEKHCFGDRLLDEAPADETIQAAVKLGGEVRLVTIDHVRGCGAGGTAAEAEYLRAHSTLDRLTERGRVPRAADENS